MGEQPGFRRVARYGKFSRLLLRRLGFDSVWRPLLGTVAVVTVPAGLLILLLAYSLYGSAVSNLQATQSSAASARAATVRAWLDAGGRSLANEAFAASYVGAARCDLLAGAFLRRNSGFSSVRFFDDSSQPCAAGEPIEAAALPEPSPRSDKDEADYRLIVVGARIWILAGDAAGGRGFSVLVVDDAALRRHLKATTPADETHVALIGADGDPVSANPAGADKRWLPGEDSRKQRSVWRGSDRSGGSGAFAFAPIEGSSLGVLIRFDDQRLNGARQRLIVLLLAQLSMLALLVVVYATSIKRDVVQWIHGIDAAARARGLDPESTAKAPVMLGMPQELRSVAESFNAMADRSLEHQQALRSSVAENRALMLEMHHRIKNSLQVIQSYLALIRRSAAKPEATQLARIEARVGVLAVAYRLALTPKGMRPIAVKPFLEEICATTVGSLRKPRQRAAYAIEWNGELVVDRAIPLGLGLVEALIAAFSAVEGGYIGVRLAADGEGFVEMVVESDALPTEAGLPEKVMRGLANQLGATPSAGAGDILNWRFSP